MRMRREPPVQLKTPAQFRLMREAGLVVAAALDAAVAAAQPGASTADLDAVAAAVITGAGATASFLGYHGYPATLCVSVNDEIVHGIPAADRVLADGDVVSIDCGAIVDGWHGDAARTVTVGQARDGAAGLLAACEEAMWQGLAAARPGARLTDISHAIETTIKAGGRYGIVDGYGGHGIGTEMHQDPHVLNFGRPGKGPQLVPGMALAIEPMITYGSPRTAEMADGWTVVTRDGSVAVHVEHTIAIFDDGVWVTTAADGGVERLGDLVTARARG
jgi:methionyl aminopeptidase